VTIRTNSPEETEAFAAGFARTLKSGDVVALDGELGAGKTAFVRGLVRGLGGDPRQVSSPTFVLLHVYQTPAMPVFHLDAYRVAGADDFEAIGFAELLEQGGVVVVEWAARVRELLPPAHRRIALVATGPTEREITVAAGQQ
jgi:tRNA threonylcarbamoyladenosine biosynthesis protein TsaE